MIYRFDLFCEKFAMAYRPIQHQPSKDGRQTRFFRHDTTDQRMEIHKRLAATDRCDIFMSVITATEGQLIRSDEKAFFPNFYVWRRHVLFWVHASAATTSVVPLDEEAAAEAKARGVECATDFIAFMSELQDPRSFPNPKDRLIDGVDLDSIEIVSLPITLDNWWITVLNFDQLEPRNRCVIDERYNADLVAEYFPKLLTSSRHKSTFR